MFLGTHNRTQIRFDQLTVTFYAFKGFMLGLQEFQ